MRITTNTVIFMQLCPLALDHWRGKILFLMWFSAILSDSWWFMNQSEIVLGWFSVILDNSWWFMNHSEIIFGVILSDLQISLKLFWGNSWWFPVIYKPLWTHFWGDSQWFGNQFEIVLGQFSVICEHFENIFGVILSDLQTTLNTFLRWFSVICESVWNCFGTILWFLVICEPLWKHFWGNSWSFTKQSEIVLGWFLVILDDSLWFTNHSEIIFGAILGDSQWFTNHSEIIFGVILNDSWWFLMICKSVWNCFGAILDDLSELQTSLKLFWGDSEQFSVILGYS